MTDAWRSRGRDRLGRRATAGGRSGARWSPSTTRPASTNSPAALTRPVSRSCPPARRPRASRDAGVPVTPVEDAHRLPRVPRRPGQDAAPDVHAGLLADQPARARTASSSTELGVEPFDLLVINLYPFRETVASGRERRRVHRADRHRRAGDGAGGREEPRQRRRRHLTRRSTPSVLDALRDGGFDPRPAAARSPPRRSRTPRPTTWQSRPGWAASSRDTSDGTGFPAWIGATWDRAAVLRYGENPHQRAALYRADSRRRRSGAGRAAARQGDVVQQLRRRRRGPARGVRLRRSGRGDHQARQPVWHRGRRADVAEAHRKAHACDPVSAYGGVIATNVPVTVELAEQVADIFTEVIVAPAYDDGRPRRAGEAEEPPDPALPAGPSPRPRRVPRGISGGVLGSQTVDRIDATGDDPATLDAGHRRPGRRRADLADLAFAWRAVPLGEVQRDPARARRCVGRCRHGPGEPGRLGAARRRAVPASGPRARWPPRTRSSRSPTACRC